MNQLELFHAVAVELISLATEGKLRDAQAQNARADARAVTEATDLLLAQRRNRLPLRSWGVP